MITQCRRYHLKKECTTFLLLGRVKSNLSELYFMCFAHFLVRAAFTFNVSELD